MSKGSTKYFIFALLILASFLIAGCNPATVGSSSKAGNPSELKVKTFDSSGIPVLTEVGSPVVIMFTGNY